MFQNSWKWIFSRGNFEHKRNLSWLCSQRFLETFWVIFKYFETFIWFLPLYSQDRQLRHMVLATLPRIPCAFGASDTRDDDCPKPNHTWKPGLRTNSSIFSEHDLKDANISGQIAKLIHSSKVGFLKGVWQGGPKKWIFFCLSKSFITYLISKMSKPPKWGIIRTRQG